MRAKGALRVSVHLLDFKFWTYSRTGNVRFSYNTIIMLPIVAVEAIVTSFFWGGGGNPSAPPLLCM